MNIVFADNEHLFTEMQDAYNAVDPEEVIFLNHHKLAELSTYTADQWKSFLAHPQVRDYVTEELLLFKDHQTRNMLKRADTLERSVGAAQMLNALNKTDFGLKDQGAETYIYMYVPPNAEERNAPNVQELPHDIFRLGD